MFWTIRYNNNFWCTCQYINDEYLFWVLLQFPPYYSVPVWHWLNWIQIFESFVKQSSVTKCYNSGCSGDFSDLQGESVWEKRETSLSIEEVKELKLKCQILKRWNGCLLFLFIFGKMWFCDDCEHSLENMTITSVHMSLTLLSFIK